MAGFTVTRRGISEGHSYGRGGPGLLLPSGGDDTAAINTAITSGQQLGVGTFKASGVINGYPRGQGAGRTTIQATSAAARIQAGPNLGAGSSNDSGTYGAFTFDGMGLSTGTLLLSNTVGTTVLPIILQNGLGDGLVVGGQNCTFITPESGQVTGCSFAMDNGGGGNTFINFEFSGAQQYHMEFRETVNTLTYPVPTNNVFIGGRTEYGYGNITTGPNAGAVHFLAANHNEFFRCDFDTPTGTRVVYAEPNTAPGRSADYNSRNVFKDCTFGSGSATLTSAIACSAAVMGGDTNCIVLDGDAQFSTAQAVPAISWSNPTNYVRLTGRYTLFNNTSGFYVASGSGTYLRSGDNVTGWVGGWTLGTSVTDGGVDLASEAISGMADSGGVVHVTGALKIGAAVAANATLATLPVSLRPSKSRLVSCTIWQSGVAPMAALVVVASSGVLNTSVALAAGQYVLIDSSEYPLHGTGG